MAFFCSIGGSGSGAGATITISYSSDFYGQTITATNGTETHTATATSSGETEFKISEGGTWVISSTISGQTFSTTVEVDIDYTATLEAIPNGSTVTPTDDIQTWLKCAGIRDKTTYTTLAEVLADTATFIALCADSNASDYMARSTTWASGVSADATAMLIVGKYNYCANALLGNSTWRTAICGSTYFEYVLDTKVPTMTSNTTPSGVVSASSSTAAAPPWKMFDNNSSPYWESTSATNQWVEYQFSQAVTVCQVMLQSYGGSYGPNATKVQAYVNGDWEDVISQFSLPNDSTKHYYTSEVIKTSDRWRFYFGSGYGSGSMTVLEGQFYGRTEKGYTGTVIHSAVEDTIYYMSGGSPVTFCGISSGDTGTVLASTIEALKNQTVTLYSSVAKDPTNLSNDYSKSIRITPNVTEIYLMPEGAVYWYGNICTWLTGGQNFAGWTNPVAGTTVGNGTANTNTYTSGGVSAGMRGYGTVNKIDITNYDALKIILTAVSDAYYGCYLQASSNKSTITGLDATPLNPQPATRITTTGVGTLDISSYSGEYGIAEYAYHTSTNTMSAMWLE